ncbi:MAPEG family protein [Pseudaestuariivita atlantica]|uniref:Glutathione metabolism protein n=1 Tax=Pseudaestuariivita atlantica TaxID=1317121 RepID=A0A0L1JTQ1_9RHOB|nr:MAPEG family protein [Pseudaestuariivita atlantica]KNG95125.1 hypothetical protein ATO11_00260 [Pseudaestuariivita atlantica]
MPLPITAFYAGLVALLFITLSVRVIRYRRGAGISLGDKGDKVLMRRIRAQANCAEYAPMGLILLGLAEGLGTPGWVLHLLGLSLLAGRAMHGAALSSPSPRPKLRVGGMMLTFAMIGLTAIGLVAHAVI